MSTFSDNTVTDGEDGEAPNKLTEEQTHAFISSLKYLEEDEST